jgi:hypothetical protein
MEPVNPAVRLVGVRSANKLNALAYFITFRTYGSWLHGDERGSVDDRHNVPGSPRLQPNQRWRVAAEVLLEGPPMLFGDRERMACEQSIRETCAYRRWKLRAVNVRTNHVHLVVSADVLPERVMRDLKAYATRALRQSGLVDENRRVWARHGSTRMIYTPEGVERACVYTLEQQ